MFQPLFKDVGKRVTDLLTKEFPAEKQERKVDWKSTTASGTKLEVDVKTTEDRDGSKTVGTLKNTYFVKPYDANVSVSLNTDKEFKSEVSFQDKFVRGLKTIFKLESQNKKSGLEYYGVAEVEYKHELATATVAAEYGRASENALKGSLVVVRQGVTVGCNAEYLRTDVATDLKELKTSVGYASGEFDVVAYGKVNQGRDKKSRTEVGASYFHLVNSGFKVGTEVKFDVTTKDAEKKPTLTFGSEYRWDKDTTLKAKYDTDGRLGLSYGLQINPQTKLLASAQIDTNEPSGKHGTQFGFNLSLSA